MAKIIDIDEVRKNKAFSLKIGIHKRLKAYSVYYNVPMSIIVEDAITEYLDKLENLDKLSDGEFAESIAKNEENNEK